MNLETDNTRFDRRPVLSKVLLVVISSVFTLVVGEAILRFSGKKTGYVPRYSRFRPVDSLEVYDSFLTDGEGVFKANPNYGWDEEGYVNSDGFRSQEFEPDSLNEKSSILFLGDSFTWGSSARPITDCFVDIVSRSGFVTYNTGIPGTDPTQYAFLAEKYVPLLEPDFVAVMFYMGNDFKPPTPMLPYKNLFHVTNAKMFHAFDKNGNYMTAEEAYKHYLAQSNAAKRKSPPNTIKGRIQNVFMKTVLGTYFWVGAAKLKRILLKDSQATDEGTTIKYEYTQECLHRIKAVTKKYDAKFMLFVLPVHPEKSSIYSSVDYNLVHLQEFDPYVPDFLERGDYMTLPNAHFNNSGHRKYAQFILEKIRELQPR